MSYDVYEMADLPVVVFQANEDYNAAKEMIPGHQDVLALLESGEHPVYHLVDMLRPPPLSFDAMQEGANASARGPNPVFHHPRVKQVIFVTADPVLKTVIKAMQTETYGNLVIQQFDVMDDALDHIRADMA